MRELGTYAAHLSKVALSATSTPDADVVFLAGHLDLNTASYTQQRIVGGPEFASPRLVLELTGLDLLDSSGIGALVQLRRAVTARGARLVLVTDSPHLRKLFKISALDQVVAIHETLEDALDEDDPDDSEPAAS